MKNRAVGATFVPGLLALLLAAWSSAGPAAPAAENPEAMTFDQLLEKTTGYEVANRSKSRPFMQAMIKLRDPRALPRYEVWAEWGKTYDAIAAHAAMADNPAARDWLLDMATTRAISPAALLEGVKPHAARRLMAAGHAAALLARCRSTLTDATQPLATRILTLGALAAVTNDEAVALARPCLDAPEWPLRLAALKALVAMGREKDLIERWWRDPRQPASLRIEAWLMTQGDKARNARLTTLVAAAHDHPDAGFRAMLRRELTRWEIPLTVDEPAVAKLPLDRDWKLATGIPLLAQEPVGVDRLQEPVATGVPLPQGAIRSPDQLRLEQDGQLRPAQFTPLAKWPDGSLRWVLASTLVSVKANETAAFTLRAGEAAAPNPAIVLDDRGDKLTVNTGVLSFSLDKRHFRLIEQVKLRDRLLFDGGAGIVLTGGDGTRYTAAFAENPSFEVEQTGPVHAVVAVRGKLRSRDGRAPIEVPANLPVEFRGPSDEAYFNREDKSRKEDIVFYTVRIHAFAGSPRVKMVVTLENNGATEARPNMRGAEETFYFKDLVLDLGPAPRGEACAEGVAGIALGEQPLRLLQRHHFVSQFGETANLVYELRQGGRLLTSDGRSLGSLDLALPNGGLQTTVRHFWQNYPQALSAGPAETLVELWPRGECWPAGKARWRHWSGPAGPGDHNPNQLYMFRAGVHKTHHVILDFHEERRSAAQVENAALAVQRPLMLMAPPAWYDQTACFSLTGLPGTFDTGDAGMNEALERADRLTLCKAYFQKSGSGGIEPASIYTKREKSARYSFYESEWYGWMNFGDLQWFDNYCSLHYDAHFGMLLAFLRLGHRAFFDLGEEMALHHADIDQNHSTRESVAIYGYSRYEKTNIPAIHYGGFRPKPSHTWSEGMLLYYLLTGDKHSYDSARIVAEGARWRYLWKFNLLNRKIFNREIRDPGWQIMSLLACHRVDANPEWLEAAKIIFRNDLLNGETISGGKGWWESFAPGGKQPVCCKMNMFEYVVSPVIALALEHGDEEARQLLVRMADFVLGNAVRGGFAEGNKYRPFGVCDTWYPSARDNTVEGRRRVGNRMFHADFLGDLLTAATTVDGKTARLADADRAYRDYAFYSQEKAGDLIDPRTRTVITYQPRNSPGAETKMFRNLRTNLRYLHSLHARVRAGQTVGVKETPVYEAPQP